MEDDAWLSSASVYASFAVCPPIISPARLLWSDIVDNSCLSHLIGETERAWKRDLHLSPSSTHGLSPGCHVVAMGARVPRPIQLCSLVRHPRRAWYLAPCMKGLVGIDICIICMVRKDRCSNLGIVAALWRRAGDHRKRYRYASLDLDLSLGAIVALCMYSCEGLTACL